MDQAGTGKGRVRCPGCSRLFEFDAENRGCATKCSKCHCDFLIPESGDEGVLLGTSDECFDIRCPHCQTEFVLPQEYRGELADCAECHRLFQIPETGHLGVAVNGEDAAAIAAAAPPRSEEAPKRNRPPTVFLSRKEVLDQAEKAQRERMERLMPPTGIRRQGQPEPVAEPAAAAAADSAEDVPLQRPVLELASSPVLEPLAGRGIRRSELPDWLPPLDFEKREKILEFEAGAEPPLIRLQLATLVPVVLIPAAVYLGQVVPPVMAAAFGFAVGLLGWGITTKKLFPVLSRKVLILTNFRVIMADHHEVVDIDLL